jgi:hypothetical protein
MSVRVLFASSRSNWPRAWSKTCLRAQAASIHREHPDYTEDDDCLHCLDSSEKHSTPPAAFAFDIVCNHNSYRISSLKHIIFQDGVLLHGPKVLPQAQHALRILAGNNPLKMYAPSVPRDSQESLIPCSQAGSPSSLCVMLIIFHDRNLQGPTQLTNGGGIGEEERARVLSKLLCSSESGEEIPVSSPVQ